VGRGVYWQWIGYLPRPIDGQAISSDVSFGCSKFFLTVDTGSSSSSAVAGGTRLREGPPESRYCQLRADWDWHRLIQALKPGSAMERELERLVLHEGFMLHAAVGGAAGILRARRVSGRSEAAESARSRVPEPLAGFPALLPDAGERSARLDRAGPG